MVGWHHQLDGHEFGWALGVSDGQGALVCCDSWECKESDTSKRQLNGTESEIHIVQWVSTYLDSHSDQDIRCIKHTFSDLVYVNFAV